MATHPIHTGNRRSIRLKGYDYSQTGAYFITICTQNRHHLFGEIIDGKMILNDAGKMVWKIWNEIPAYYSGIDIDAFQAMPNHIHGIIQIAPPTETVGAGPRACPDMGQPQNIGQPQGVAPTGFMGQPPNTGQPRGVAPTMSLSDVVRRFKTMTTKRYTDGVKKHRWLRFDGKLWQRNYWEHIIRNEIEYHRIVEYVHNNPAKWENDRLNNKTGNIVMETHSDYGAEPWIV